VSWFSILKPIPITTIVSTSPIVRGVPLSNTNVCEIHDYRALQIGQSLILKPAATEVPFLYRNLTKLFAKGERTFWRRNCTQVMRVPGIARL
jgi:hypothetical protein